MIKFNAPNIKLWWHLPNKDNSTPELQITFELDAKIKSMQEEGLLITWIGWSISCVYLAEIIKDVIAWPSKVYLSDHHHLEALVLKSTTTIEEAGFKSLILDKNKFMLEQNASNSSELWFGDL